MFESLSQSDNQNLIYSIVILIFLLIGVFSRRDLKFSQILKYLALWGLVALAIVALYSYRFEFSSFKNRILAELNPSAARLDNQGRIVLNISQDGHFYANTKINGHSIRFMIDTGASDIVINIEDAKRIGINPQKLNFNKRYETANGVVFGASIILQEFEIGEVKFKNIDASVNSADLGVSLLGMSFLRQFKRYEFFQDQLILEM